ncbi:MAG: LysR family transcriptional regulator [Burkholderiaceae bacterium]
MDLRQLNQFVVVAEEQAFRRAAQRLCMAQPPLSVAIRKLEEEVGHSLFVRTRHGVTLTAAGVAAYETAKRCLRAAEEVSQAAMRAAAGAHGTIRIGFVGSVTFGLMPTLVAAFGRRHPCVKIEVREGSNAELHEALRRDEIDVALVRLPVARPAGIRFEIVEDDVLCAALPAGHRLLHAPAVRVADLKSERLIGYSPSRANALYIAALQVFQQAPPAPDFALEAVQVTAMIGLVEAKLGLALIPSAMASHYVGRVGFRRIVDLPDTARISVAAAYRDSEPGSGDASVLGSFLSLARRHYDEQAPRADPLAAAQSVDAGAAGNG